MNSGLESLVLRARKADADAYSAIVHRFQDMAVGYGYSILRDFQLAEDAAQEAFFEAYRNLEKLREPAAFPGWFRRISSTKPSLCGDDQSRGRLSYLKGRSNMKERVAWIIGLALTASLLTPSISSPNQKEGKMDPKQFFDAVMGGDTATVKELVTKDPSLARAQDEKGVSAILLAVYYRKKEIVDLLVSAAQYLNVFEAAATGQTARVKALLAKDPDLANAYSADGFPPLGLATFFGHGDTAVLLISSGAQVDAAARNAMKVRPLHAAAAARQVEIARMLIERGADVNARQQSDFTPLHEAAGSGQVELAELLLRHGADVNAKTDAGKTPLTLAVEAGQSEMAVILRKHGAVQ